MLVLEREVQQSIIITCPNGDTIRITPTRVRGDRTRIGVEAPASYRIDREEVARERLIKVKANVSPPPETAGA
jgi:carbon storage regulator CsrA